MPLSDPSFVVLDAVDSTNNYAMALVHEGLAKQGDAVFSHIQTAGKGQRGKAWHSGAGENIALSIILEPRLTAVRHHAHLSMLVALGTRDFFASYAGEDTCIKWPNDIYWRDRKAGGILIENKLNGQEWRWSIIGIGLNINQSKFHPDLHNPISLKKITGESFDTVQLARELYTCVSKRITDFRPDQLDALLAEYHRHMYKINKQVRFKKGTMTFEAMVKGVSRQGHLITFDVIEKQFAFGEITWVL